MTLGALLCLCAFGIMAFGLIRGRFFSPLVLFFGFHLLALGASTLGFFNFKAGYSIEFYQVLAASYLAFAAGCFIGGVALKSGSKTVSPEKLGMNTKVETFAFVVGLSCLLILYFQAGGWPMLSASPGARETFAATRMKSLAFSFSVASSIICISNAVKLRSKRSIVYVSILAGLIALTGNRGFLFLNATYFLSMREVVLGRSAKVAVFIIGPLLVGFFLLVGYFRDFGPSGITVGGGLGMFALALVVYEYLCNGYWNLGKGMAIMVAGGKPITFGLSSFAGIAHWFTNVFVLQESYGWDSIFNESVIKYKGLNSCAFQWALMKDFGVVGMLIATFAIAAILQAIHGRTKSSFVAGMLYCFLVHQVIFSFNIFWMGEGILVASFFFYMIAVTTSNYLSSVQGASRA